MSHRAQEQLEATVRQTPLKERLTLADEMIGQMCSQGRPPKMTIPVQATDEDFFIGVTLRDARAEIERQKVGPSYDLVTHLDRQRAFSLRTFGPGLRTKGVVDHIKKELKEIEANPGDLDEFIDVAMLAFDGAWRSGFEPSQIAAAFEAKLTKNENRTWPDWRTADPEKAIEHVRMEGK